MTPIHIRIVAVALSIALGSFGCTELTRRSANDQNRSGTIAPTKRMADGKVWMTSNLNAYASSSYCDDDVETNCSRYGRLYTWSAAQQVCASLGDGWRLLTDDEWRQMAKHYGGVSDGSADKVGLRSRAKAPHLGRFSNFGSHAWQENFRSPHVNHKRTDSNGIVGFVYWRAWYSYLQ